MLTFLSVQYTHKVFFINLKLFILHPKPILKFHMRFLPKTLELSCLAKSFTVFFLLYVKDSTRNRVYVSAKHSRGHLREWVEFSAVLLVPIHSKRWILLLTVRRLRTTALLLKFFIHILGSVRSITNVIQKPVFVSELWIRMHWSGYGVLMTKNWRKKVLQKILFLI